MHALALLLLLPSAPLPPEKPKAPPPKDEEKIQGIWKATSMERSGAAMAVPGTERYTLVLVGDAYVFNTHGGKMAIDFAKKTVDLTITEGRYKGTTIPGIFEIKGDTLKIAMPSSTLRPGERPTDLKTGEATTHTLYTFERDGKATKEQAAAKLKELTESLPVAARGGFPAPIGGPRGDAATQAMLREIIEKLDRIEKRLDALEKKNQPEKK